MLARIDCVHRWNWYRTEQGGTGETASAPRTKDSIVNWCNCVLWTPFALCLSRQFIFIVMTYFNASIIIILLLLLDFKIWAISTLEVLIYDVRYMIVMPEYTDPIWNLLV